MACAPIRLRYIMAGVFFLGNIIFMIVQSSMSITILAMTKPLYDTTTEPPDYGPRYEWSAYDQSLVLGAYAWGAMVIQTIIGVIVERFGPRKVGVCALLAVAVLSTLTPTAASILWVSILLRFCMGFFMGMTLPIIQALIANWVPPEEKGFFISSLLANMLGTVIDWSISGIIIETIGWHYAFYVVVILLAIFVIIWFFIIYDSPSKHPKITEAERDYIIGKLNTSTKRKIWPPYRSILLSVPFWALVILQFGASWGIYFFIVATPRYLSDVHKFTITNTGLVGSIPYLARFIGGLSFGLIGDFVYQKKLMSVTLIRKFFSLFSHIIPGCLLIGLTFFGDQPNVCVVFLSLAMGISGATTVTNLQNPHDISPNFAVTVYSIGAIFANIPGFVAPLVVAFYTQEKSSEDEWRPIFFIGAGIYIATAIVYLIFGTGKVQKWNNIKVDADEIVDKSVNLPDDNRNLQQKHEQL